MSETPSPSAERFRLGQLRCPRRDRPVQELLDEGEDGLVVRENGVLDLAIEDHYWNHLDREEMGELLALTRAEGWRVALDRVLRPRVDDYTFAYATDPRRADWLPLCPIPPRADIIDIGAGWGAVCMALAEQGHRVFALDSNLETLDFLSQRATQQDLAASVLPVRIDPLEKSPLPFEDESADLVVLNGVLEWVGTAVQSPSPRELQRRLLVDVRRVLRPSGCLYLAIESRFGLAMLLGGQDHPGTRFTSVLPRFAASWITRRAGKGDYRTWTYGHAGLRDLLLEAGFTETRFHSPFPDYRFPHSMVPLEDAALFRETIRRPGLSEGHARLLRASSWLGLQKVAVSHYAVVARP